MTTRRVFDPQREARCNEIAPWLAVILFCAAAAGWWTLWVQPRDAEAQAVQRCMAAMMALDPTMSAREAYRTCAGGGR